MPSFPASDGTSLAYRSIGAGDPLLCLPGGPTRDAAYLGDLGGLARHRRLLLPDPRGTVAGDEGSRHRQVDDVEALRQHLGLGRIDLLGHSAGADLAVQYAARHPDAVRRLVLIAPSLAGVGLPARRETAQFRTDDESWLPAAVAALAAIGAGKGSAADWAAIIPLRYGWWDEAARQPAAPGTFTPDATRAALAAFPAPVLVLAGEFDLSSPPPMIAGYAALFPDATLVVQPEAGHRPWLDDPEEFVSTVAAFLA